MAEADPLPKRQLIYSGQCAQSAHSSVQVSGVKPTADLLPCMSHLIDEGVHCCPVHICAEAQACAEDEGLVHSDKGGVDVRLLTVTCSQGKRNLSRCCQGPCWQLPVYPWLAAHLQQEGAGSSHFIQLLLHNFSRILLAAQAL